MSEADGRHDYRSLLRDALLKVRELKSRIVELEQAKRAAIAIVGIGCRFPAGICGPEAYWRLLRDGAHVISEVPTDRWNIDDYFHPESRVPGKICSRHGGYLDNIADFDAGFFEISDAEATSMDPQHRLLLEVAWEALENAGQAPDRLYNQSVGVFVGISSNDYFHLLSQRDERKIDSYFGTGVSHSASAGRISHRLGLRGPSMAIDTACSSSLVATHLACQSLESRECDLALAAGVNVRLTPHLNIYFSQAGLLSTDGRCKTFAASADGVVPGEGCGVLVLKRLPDALADRDNILSIIRGSAVNHDGPSGGLTVPHGPAQQAVIRRALEVADVDPLEVGVVEAHGAGTLLGDAIELGALATLYCHGRSPDQPLMVASHKPNLGHLESAGGIAGLIKMALILHHGEIPPHLNVDQPNPHVHWERLPLRIPTQCTPWGRTHKRRIGAVSSFSFSGTNAHVVIEEPPEPNVDPPGSSHPHYLLTLSAKCPQALHELVRLYAARLKGMSDVGDVCFTTNLGRSHFEHRLAVLTDSGSDAARRLERFLATQPTDRLYQGTVTTDTQTHVGSQWTSVKPRGPANQAGRSESCHLAMLETSAQQYVQGHSVDWALLWQDGLHDKVALPTYPFQRRRFWITGMGQRQLS
jgi:acyl transferase domain-containing protein